MCGMLDTSTIQSLAAELQQAEITREQIPQFSRRFNEMTIDDSYAIQRAWVNLKHDSGRETIGHKIGLTSRAMQIASQIEEPDYGALLDNMLLYDGAEIDAGDYIVPRIEAEFAFVLGAPLHGSDVTLADVMRATDYVVPALELIDARIEQLDRNTGAPRTVLDTIADNAANAAIVLGTEKNKPDDVDWRWAGALLYKNNVVEESGLGAAVLDHPANGVAWLANKLAKFGEGLEAGEIVLGGSFIRPVACSSGDVIRADYGPLGLITVSFN
jgi:2-oxo-hept-3-ene-1,7-dioate hydratase